MLLLYCPYVIKYHSELSAEKIEIWEEAHDFHNGRAVAKVQPFPRSPQVSKASQVRQAAQVSEVAQVRQAPQSN